MPKLIGLSLLLIGLSIYLSFADFGGYQQNPLPELAGLDDYRVVRPQSPGNDFSTPATLRVINTIAGNQINEEQVNLIFKTDPPKQLGASYSWISGNLEVSTVAQGLDRNYHFANSFLVDFVPFKNVSAWVPVAALSSNKIYAMDFKSHRVLDVWQTSREAYFYPTGDCEDHAIAVVDWLIGLGYDARVVLGTVDNIGHAWAVIVYGNKVYLIEATDKSLNGRHIIPLASNFPKYLPYAMFNRNNYWVNYGIKFGSDYLNKQWVSTSRYSNGN